METAELVLRYIQTLLSWPVVCLILGLVALALFREPMSDFLRRMVRGEGYGVRFEAANPSQQRKGVKETTIKQQTEDGLERYIKENPADVVREYFRLYNGFLFERAYNLIYGTQLQILDFLSTRGNKGEKYVNLLPYYNEFLKRSGLHSTQMADYLGFLRDMNFMEYVADGTDQRATITPLGVDFLSYIKTHYRTGYRYKAF